MFNIFIIDMYIVIISQIKSMCRNIYDMYVCIDAHMYVYVHICKYIYIYVYRYTYCMYLCFVLSQWVDCVCTWIYHSIYCIKHMYMYVCVYITANIPHVRSWSMGHNHIRDSIMQKFPLGDEPCFWNMSWLENLEPEGSSTDCHWNHLKHRIHR